MKPDLNVIDENRLRLRLSIKVYCTILHPSGRSLRPLQHHSSSTASDPQVFIGVILLLRVPLSTVMTAGLMRFWVDVAARGAKPAWMVALVPPL